LPPRRHRERAGGGFKELITDEQEWLARPEIWGMELLPDKVRGRRGRLFECHLRDWLAVYVRCNLCRSRITELWPEYEDERRFADLDVFDIHGWYTSTHPASEKCDGWRVMLPGVQYQRKIICPSEARNNVLAHLQELLHPTPDMLEHIELRKALRLWRKSIALELIGPNPFRPVSFDPSWRTSTTVALANQMYDSRYFSIMPILGDALQDAGCESAESLDHCRGPGPHVRGCWVVDLVLGKS
jgi:hypothetical protein